MKRRPGLVGLYLRSGHQTWAPSKISISWPSRELDDRLLPAGARALDRARGASAWRHLDDVHALHLDVEELLDGLADLRLVRVLVHLERVLALVDRGRSSSPRRRARAGPGWDAGSRASPLRPVWRGPATSGSAGLGDDQRARPHDVARPRARTAPSTATRSRLRNDLMTLSSSSVATTTSGRSLPQLVQQLGRRARRRRVERRAVEHAERASGGVRRRALRGARRAAALRFTFTSKLRVLGGKATPPPVNCGARVVPWRARPVPFWRHGLARPPATRPRLFAARVPARRAFSSARTASCTRCGLTSAPKISSDSDTSAPVFEQAELGGLRLSHGARPPAPRRCRSSAPARRP